MGVGAELDWWYGWSPAESPREIAQALDYEAADEHDFLSSVGSRAKPDEVRRDRYERWAEQLAVDWRDMFPGDPLPERFVERVKALLMERAE